VASRVCGPMTTLDLPIDDVHYRLRVHGDGPALLMLHGFTGSGATWEPHAVALSNHYRCIAVDLLGHGRTRAPADPTRFTAERAVRDLLAILDALGLQSVAVFGYSMGGRLALNLALAAPNRIHGLILESASPGIADPSERAARVAADEALAKAIVEQGVEAFVARWEALPLFSSQAALPPAARERLRAQRLDNNPMGLANSLRGMGAGTMPAVRDRLAELRMPTLLIAGALDDKYRQLALSMARDIPGAAVAIVPGAGHAVHLERPDEFDYLVGRFLAAVTAQS
jgi:2-succinyl-6-hydroxy-2,4-cyclohexadiene-1-carboxylate synthase